MPQPGLAQGTPAPLLTQNTPEVADLTRGEGALATVRRMAGGMGLLFNLGSCLPGSCWFSEETQGADAP